MAYKTGGVTRISDSRDATLTNVATPTTGALHINSVGSGGVTIPSPMLGTVKGMVAGGEAYNGTSYYKISTIETFPFANETSTTITGNLKLAIGDNTGLSSITDGYTVGGSTSISPISGNPTPGLPVYIDNHFLRSIDKIPFSISNSVSFVGNLAAERYLAGGHSSPLSGYVSGGMHVPSGIIITPPSSPLNPGSEAGVAFSSIESFTFSSGGVISSYVGDLAVESSQTAAHSSETHGFSCQNSINFARIFPFSPAPRAGANRIDKFPFSTSITSATIGDTIGDIYQASISSPSTGYGYIAGYYEFASLTSYNGIQKYPFASNAFASIIGGLSIATSQNAGLSSSTHGYAVSGGIPLLPYTSTNIDKFPFATDNNSSYVGDLGEGRVNLKAGMQD